MQIYTKPKLLTILFFLTFFFNYLLANHIPPVQHRNYAQELIQQNLAALESTALTQPFSMAVAKNKKVDEALNGEKDLLELDKTFNQEVLKHKNEVLKISIPRKAATPWHLNLKKVNFFDPSFIISTSSLANIDQSELGVFYWGILEGDENSSVSINIFKNEISGIIHTKQGNYTLGKLKDSNTHILYQEADLVEPFSFTCDTEFDAEQFDKLRADVAEKVNAGLVNPDNCVRIYFEADYALYQQFNDVTAVANYVTGLFNEVAVIYTNEYINLTISEIKVWDTPDSYNPNYILQQFAAANPSINGDIGHLLAYYPGGGGGAAVNTTSLCPTHSYTYAGSSYAPLPHVNGIIGVVAHEIGHNLGSPHTHDCVWNGNNTQIDDCGNTGKQYTPYCFDPYNQKPASNTIMSYCGKDFNAGFGQQPGDRIRNTVYTRSCLTTCGASPCIDGNENGTCDLDECYPSPIINYANIDNQGWMWGAWSVELEPGQSVTFGPTAPNGGTWSWSGPNGFTANTREINVSDAGFYGVTFEDGTCVYTNIVEVIVNNCLPNPIVCNTNIANQGWEQECNIGIPTGQTAVLSPTPTTGTWSWTGPNGFTASTREITISDAGEYIATHTEGTCTSEQEINVLECVTDPIICHANIANQGWQSVCEVDLMTGQSVTFGPGTSPLGLDDFFGIWTWSGPNNYYANTRETTVSASGIYTATLKVGACTFTKDMTVTVNGCIETPITCSININNQGAFMNCNGALLPGQSALLSPTVPVSGGSWFWAGPNGFTSTNRTVLISDIGSYVVTYTDTNGCPNTETFTISENHCVTPIVCNADVNNQGMIQTCEVTMNYGQSALLSPTAGNLNDWSWSGSGGFSATTREVTVTEAGTYTVIYSDWNLFCVYLEEFTVTVNKVSLDIKAMLRGTHTTGGTMNSNLTNMLPLTEPYTGLGYTHVGGGGETIAISVLAATGNNAIVDWVVVELRDPNTPSAVIATRAALLQADGDVVDLDGVSPVSIGATAGDYYVAIRHRNHLGTMTAAPVMLN